ncbi:hypothetical protein IAQ61_008856 [Plenodomus lingam]|uniref:uncharacterized protein n=1 Tax=Leptosphaeria maculans TaxID=5022 RepID=UPI00332F5D18|nr:hypothetical protein IAQ61_008856 [Plenodomus lingam]
MAQSMGIKKAAVGTPARLLPLIANSLKELQVTEPNRQRFDQNPRGVRFFLLASPTRAASEDPQKGTVPVPVAQGSKVQTEIPRPTRSWSSSPTALTWSTKCTAKIPQPLTDPAVGLSISSLHLLSAFSPHAVEIGVLGSTGAKIVGLPR